MSYTKALPFVLAREGGKVDDPADRGGRTNQGITQKVYDAYRHDAGLAPRDVWTIEPEEVEAIYKVRYWDKVQGDTLCGFHPGIGIATFDCAVNSGPSRAIKHLQTALGVAPDGGLGPKTLAALAAAGDYERVLTVMLATRDTFFRSIVAHDPTQARFLKGWLNRVNALRRTVGVPEVPVTL